MAEPFISQITITAFNFAPRGYALCDGQLLPINQNQTLYALIGTRYGGDGRTTFALPDLRGRVPLQFDTDASPSPLPIGRNGGEETHQLTVSEMPSHSHSLKATANDATGAAPNSDQILATSTGSELYGASNNLVSMDAEAISSVGGSQSHNNMMPFLTVNFCIALQGTFPSRN